MSVDIGENHYQTFEFDFVVVAHGQNKFAGPILHMTEIKSHSSYIESIKNIELVFIVTTFLNILMVQKIILSCRNFCTVFVDFLFSKKKEIRSE
jgi:hypothetical protein